MREWKPSQDCESRSHSCPMSSEVVAWLQDEVRIDERAKLASHFGACDECGRIVRESMAVLGYFDGRQEMETRPDLLPRVLAELLECEASLPPGRATSRARVARFSRSAATAAVVMLTATIWMWRAGQPIVSPDTASEVAAASAATPTLDRAEHRALDWLAKAQESTGHWSAARWGGQPSYDVGLTALAAMTFLNSTPTTSGAEHGDVLRRALDYLLTRQTHGGRFGPLFDGALYNHGIATVALLEAFGRGQRPELRGPIDEAIDFLIEKQSPQGGWGYLGVAGDAPNTALTCWPLQALVVGRALGWTKLDEPIDRGLKYLEAVTDRRGRIGYRNAGDFPYGSRGPSSMGAFCVLLAREARSVPAEVAEQIVAEGVSANHSKRGVRDLYGDFFLSSALTALPAERGDQWPRAACVTLAEQQVTDGDQRGSWEPKDQWSLVGGRIYSTATATLILQSERRTLALAKWVRGG